MSAEQSSRQTFGCGSDQPKHHATFGPKIRHCGYDKLKRSYQMICR